MLTVEEGSNYLDGFTFDDDDESYINLSGSE